MTYLALAGGIVAIEILLRLAIRFGVKSASAPSWWQRFSGAMRDQVRLQKLLATTQPHPFLQFTRPRSQLIKGDQDYGFEGIRLSDVPKPAGIIRVACLGGGDTERGYPEFLRSYLSDARAMRFQVLSFAVEGWSSAHSMVNFILNVRDFAPDLVVIGDELRAAACTGYPCGCPGAIHAYAPPSSPVRARDGWLLRRWRTYLIVRLLLAGRLPPDEENTSAVDRDAQLYQHRRNLETICTLAAADRIKIILLTMPLRLYAEGAPPRAVAHAMNEIIRDLARRTGAILADLDRAMPMDLAIERGTARAKFAAEQIGALILENFTEKAIGCREAQ